MKVLPDDERGSHSIQWQKWEYHHFLAVWTKFDTFYFQILC
jgi:hypothetical protein